MASKAAPIAVAGPVQSMGATRRKLRAQVAAAMVAKARRAPAMVEVMVPKAPVTADHDRIMVRRGGMAATILKAVMAGKLRRARMAERKVAIHKGAMGDQRVDRANKGMASNAVMAAKAGKRRTDRRVTSKQHKVVTHHKVDTDRKVDMALGPILVAKVGSKWEAGAPSKVTLPKRAN
ncbi:MAG: hypothetical protein ACXWI8_16640, partial [Burkholderiales bacterium]